jgi:hypothetical protein
MYSVGREEDMQRIMHFNDWLIENGYYTYRKAYDIWVSRGYDPEELMQEYEELEQEFLSWCEENGCEALID